MFVLISQNVRVLIHKSNYFKITFFKEPVALSFILDNFYPKCVGSSFQ
jgi:hypothetical protein